MARRIKNIKLDSRNARRDLRIDKNPYWVRIDRNSHLGYRKGKKGGSWIARIRLDDGFKMHRIGTADDTSDADNVELFDYFQAQEKAREWFEQAIKVEKGIGKAKYKVNDALDEYIEYLEMHGKSAQRAQYCIEAYIRNEFGSILVSNLQSKKISDWHKKLVDDKPRKRAKKGKISFNNEATKEDDYLRKRKATANRILTILKAALNRSYNEGKVASDDAWRRIKPYRNVDHAKIRFLKLGECGRLVNACDKDFKALVQVALLTGCRWGELINMRVQDFHDDSGTLYVSDSKSGKPRHVILETQGHRFISRHIIGRSSGEYMFLREDGEQWGRSHQTRRLKDACQRAQITPAISFHILRHTHASQLVQKGVSLPVIATQLGHADTRICEKHYAHLTPDYIADSIRANFPDMQIVEEDNIVSLEKVAKCL
jgi:integrase